MTTDRPSRLNTNTRVSLITKLIFTLVGLMVGALPVCSTSAQNTPRGNKGAHQQIPNNMIVTGVKAQGSTSKAHKQQAIRSIPMHELSRDLQAQVNDVVNKAAIYRRLPPTTIHTDPDLYLFMIRYPETMLNIWQIMGVTQMKADRVAPFQLDFNDGVGTDGAVELIYGTPTLNIYYGEGVYEGPMMFRRVEGQCVLVLQTKYHRDANGKPQTTSTLDVFLKIDHMAAGIVAKTVHPLVGSTADHNFVESLRFLQKLSETTETNGNGVMGLSQRLKNIRPDVRQRFFDIVEIVSNRAANSRQPKLGASNQYPGRSTTYQRRQR